MGLTLVVSKTNYFNFNVRRITMKIYRKIFALVLVLLVILSATSVSYAETALQISVEPQYEEYHDQINFENLKLIFWQSI